VYNAAAAGQLAGILADQVAYIYQVQAEDTPSLVAAALYTLIVPNRPCLVSGATLTVPGAIQFVARTTQAASGVQEWARQEQGFRVSVWCASPSQRDTLCGAIGRQRPVSMMTAIPPCIGAICSTTSNTAPPPRLPSRPCYSAILFGTEARYWPERGPAGREIRKCLYSNRVR
jgi:hypothetical protein